MGRLQKLRNMKPAEVERVHRIFDQFGSDTEKVTELLADIRAYCGSSWPEVLQDALERYNKSRRGDEE